MIRSTKTDQFNEALDHIDAAHKIASKIDGPTASQLHLARVALEDAMAREALSTVRREWQERPQMANG